MRYDQTKREPSLQGKHAPKRPERTKLEVMMRIAKKFELPAAAQDRA
jgi:hypothetical protein